MQFIAASVIRLRKIILFDNNPNFDFSLTNGCDEIKGNDAKLYHLHKARGAEMCRHLASFVQPP